MIDKTKPKAAKPPKADKAAKPAKIAEGKKKKGKTEINTPVAECSKCKFGRIGDGYCDCPLGVDLAKVEQEEAAAKPKKGPKLVESKPPASKPPGSVTNINKRITEGARIDTWRPVRSLRKGFEGYFAQGGHYKKTNRGNEFIVGEEQFFKSLTEAQKYCNERLPAVS